MTRSCRLDTLGKLPLLALLLPQPDRAVSRRERRGQISPRGRLEALSCVQSEGHRRGDWGLDASGGAPTPTTGARWRPSPIAGSAIAIAQGRDW